MGEDGHAEAESSGSCRGLTLVEVMVTMFIVSMGIAAVLTGIAQGTRLNYAAAQRFAAFGASKELIEQMRGADFGQLTAGNYPAETIPLTHLGGSRRLSLTAQRSVGITDLADPPRKQVVVMTRWSYQNHSYAEDVATVLFARDVEAVSATLGGDVGGEISINPNNSPDNEFTVDLADGSSITRDDLTTDYIGYSGAATRVHVRPKGSGSQNTLLYNGEPYELQNGSTVDISGENLMISLYNDHVNKHGKALGHWWVQITASSATITAY